MNQATGAGLNRGLSLIGAAYAGSWLFTYQEEVLGIVGRTIGSLATAGVRGGASVPTSSDPAVQALTQHVNSLTALVTAQAQQNGRGWSFPGGANGWYTVGGVGMIGLAGVVCSKSWDELVYVSRATFARGLGVISGSLTKLSEALERTKAHLNGRIDELQGKVEEGLESQRRMEVTMEDARVELESLTAQVSNVEQILNEVAAKQETGNRGIFALCHVVNSGILTGGTVPQSAKVELDKVPVAPGGSNKIGGVGGAVSRPVVTSHGKMATSTVTLDEQLRTIQQFCESLPPATRAM